MKVLLTATGPVMQTFLAQKVLVVEALPVKRE